MNRQFKVQGSEFQGPPSATRTWQPECSQQHVANEFAVASARIIAVVRARTPYTGLQRPLLHGQRGYEVTRRSLQPWRAVVSIAWPNIWPRSHF
jgi:hypothetical protein